MCPQSAREPYEGRTAAKADVSAGWGQRVERGSEKYVKSTKRFLIGAPLFNIVVSRDRAKE
jgi:hypothetical protein